RIGRIDAIHIRINVTEIGLHGSGNGNRARIGTATTKRRDPVVGAKTLETRNHCNLPLAHAADKLAAINLADTGRTMRAIRENGNLPAKPGTGRNADALQLDGEQRDGDRLTAGDNRVI